MSKFAVVAGVSVVAAVVLVAYKLISKKSTQKPEEVVEHVRQSVWNHYEKRAMFSEVFDWAPKVPFDSSWHNGTGYFNGANHSHAASVLPIGQVLGFESDDGRKGLIVRLVDGDKGCYTVFERYSEADSPIVLCGHAFSQFSDEVWDTIFEMYLQR